MAGVMRNEGSMLGHMEYPKSDSLKTKEDFKSLIKAVTIPDLDVEKITAFYLTDVVANSTNGTKHAFWEFFGDIAITCPTYLFAKEFAQNSPKNNVYFYEWTHPSSLLSPLMGCSQEMGVCHAADIEIVFGMSVLVHSKDADFSKSVMQMWTNFAKNGKPMDGTSYKWPRLIESGVVSPVTKIKEINPTKPDTILDNFFEKT
ncbi:unnamed protein product, partial [Oppiella nova]